MNRIIKIMSQDDILFGPKLKFETQEHIYFKNRQK